MRKLTILAAATIAASALATSAQAAQTLVITGPSGVYADDEVVCGSGQSTPCAFTRTFPFTTPAGFNSVTLDLSSILNGPGTDINFTTVTFNGVPFNIVSTGIQEVRNLFSQTITPGGSNTIFVSGTTSGNGAFSGNLAFNNVPAVPEPGTWAMMLLGFGAVGWSMRRRRATPHLAQAA